MSHPDDEFLSALLDGEAPLGDVAHVDGCGDCQTRLADIRHASTLVASPVTLPPGHLREAAVAAALRVTDVSPEKRPVPRRMNALSAAAVLLVALAMGGLLISQVGRNTTTESPNSNASLAQGLSTMADAAGESDRKAAAADDASSTLSAPAEMSEAAGGGRASYYDAGDLGTVNSIEEVTRRASADLSKPAEEQLASASSQPARCPTDVLLWQATLHFDGAAAVARVIPSDAGRVMQILRQADCSVLASRDF